MDDITWKAFDKNSPKDIKSLTELGYNCRVGFMSDYIFERKTSPLKFVIGDKGETTQIEYRLGNVEIRTTENITNIPLPSRLTFKEIKGIYEVANLVNKKWDKSNE